MKATVLIDNKAPCRLASEWGLSVLIEHRGRMTLLDAGDSGAFIRNAEALDIDLSRVESAALSHAHYDHADGLRYFLSENRRAALGVVSGNPQAEAFWLKNGFSFYGAPRVDRSPVIRTMERVLNPPDKVYTHHFDIGGSHMNEYLDIKPEVREALEAGAPVVALESTILSHGMPWPENLDFAAKVEEVVRAEGAVPATMAIMGGNRNSF